MDPDAIERGHLEAIRSARGIWLHAPDGYVGTSATLELGWAAAHQIPVFSRNELREPVLRSFVHVVDGPEAMIDQIIDHRVDHRTDDQVPDLDVIRDEHRQVYDALADEYAERADSLRPVTEAAIGDLRRYVPAGSRVLDVGCGAGLAVQVLGEAGYRASGLELAPVMAHAAQVRNPEARIHVGDLLDDTTVREVLAEHGQPFNAILAFAFIHLFPKAEVRHILERLREMLTLNGVLYIGTTRSERGSEGWEGKADYPDAPRRWRAHWTRDEFLEALAGAGFSILDEVEHRDPYGKTWMDVVAGNSLRVEILRDVFDEDGPIVDDKTAWRVNPISEDALRRERSRGVRGGS